MAQGNGYDKGAATLSPIYLNRKRYVYSDKPLYRVYAQPGDFKLIEADSALEAFEKSGIARAYKIEREHFYRTLALEPEQVLVSDRPAMPMDHELPEPGAKKSLHFTAFDGDSGPVNAFEELTISSLRYEPQMKPIDIAQPERPGSPAIDEGEDDALMQEEEHEAENFQAVNPEIIPPSQPLSQAEEAAALTADEVDALLNGNA